MVDYLMALNLHNVMVASRLEKIVTFTVSAAVTDGLLSENRFPFLVFFPFYTFLLLCRATRSQRIQMKVTV